MNYFETVGRVLKLVRAQNSAYFGIFWVLTLKT